MNKSVFNIFLAASINIWTGVPHLWPALSNRMWKAEWKLGSNTRAEDPGGLSVFVFVLWDICPCQEKKAQGENIKWTEGPSCPRDVWRPAHGPQSASPKHSGSFKFLKFGFVIPGSKGSFGSGQSLPYSGYSRLWFSEHFHIKLW